MTKSRNADIKERDWRRTDPGDMYICARMGGENIGVGSISAGGAAGEIAGGENKRERGRKGWENGEERKKESCWRSFNL